MAKYEPFMIDGFEELDKSLKKIVADGNKKGLNGSMRKAARKICKEHILPDTKSLMPENTGFLKKQLKVRAKKRSKKTLGASVGFADDMFKGDTYYAGFIEYGTKERSTNRNSTGRIDEASFIRRALYDNEDKARKVFIEHLAEFVTDANREAVAALAMGGG